MSLSESDLHREAAATGFQAEPLEKVIRLLEALDTLRSHPFLKGRLVLKGGTALNLFVFDVPRLSVDIDLNYVGAVERETMLAERPKLEQALLAVCGRLGLEVKRIPTDHAGGKWRLSYTSVAGRPSQLELDVNFLLRQPLWPVVIARSRGLGSIPPVEFPVLDVHELAAGKLAALFGRTASRDIYDVHRLFQATELEPAKLRLGFVVYGGMNRRDWRSLSVDDVRADPTDFDRQLIPLLHGALTPPSERLAEWTQELIADCRRSLSTILPLADNELQFLERLNDHGEIVPDLLTDDADVQHRIRSHPGLRWKVLNVRRHLGLDD